MKITINKLLKIFKVVILTIIMLTLLLKIFSSTRANNVLNNKMNDLYSILEQLQMDQVEKEQTIKGLQEELNKTNEENNQLKQEKSKLKSDYDTLEEKYLEEITPVSYNPNNLWEKSNATVNDMTIALKGTGLESVAYYYVQAEKDWGVNAIFLASLTAEESGWGNSYRARYQNNLSGYAVYSAEAEGETFSSKEESIMATAKLICNDYLKTSGIYHNGISIYSVNIRYCPDDDGNWSNNINSIANSLVSKINNR